MSFVYGVDLTSKVNMLHPVFYTSMTVKAHEKKYNKQKIISSLLLYNENL